MTATWCRCCPATVVSRMPTETWPITVPPITVLLAAGPPAAGPPAANTGALPFAERPRLPRSMPTWSWPSSAATGSSSRLPTSAGFGCE